jgi:hypothetical protein
MTSKARDFLFSETSRPTLRPTQPPNQWKVGSFSWGYSCRGVKLETAPHPGLTFRNAWSCTSISPHYFIVVYIAKYLQQQNSS